MKDKKEKQKYLNLSREIVVMWNVYQMLIVPIDVSAQGLIAKSLDLRGSPYKAGSRV